MVHISERRRYTQLLNIADYLPSTNFYCYSRGDNSMKVQKVFALFTTLIMMISMSGVLPVAAASLPYASTGVSQTYVVLYKKNALPSGAAASITKAGGTFVYGYQKIGVVIATSDNSFFRSNLLLDSRI